MPAVKGIKFEKDTKGRAKSVTIDLKQHGNDRLLEDYLDNIAADANEKEPRYNFRDVINKIKKKRGIKE